MRVNIFEGSRRILLMLQILWAVGALALNWNSGYIDVTYQTFSPNSPFIKADSCESNDRTVSLYSQKTKSGTSFSATLCFKAQKFSNGQMLVPYKTDAEDQSKVWGNSAYSSDVDYYVEHRKLLFKIPPTDEEWIDDQGREKFTENLKDGIGYAVTGWIIIWLTGSVIGWIMRGFMGIPRSKDTKPTKLEKANLSD